VWLDTRTNGLVEQYSLEDCKSSADEVRSLCGLPINSYFSAVKIKWIIDHIPEVKLAIEDDRCLFGTVDSWIIWVRLSSTT